MPLQYALLKLLLLLFFFVPPGNALIAQARLTSRTGLPNAVVAPRSRTLTFQQSFLVRAAGDWIDLNSLSSRAYLKLALEYVGASSHI